MMSSITHTLPESHSFANARVCVRLIGLIPSGLLGGRYVCVFLEAQAGGGPTVVGRCEEEEREREGSKENPAWCMHACADEYI